LAGGREQIAAVEKQQQELRAAFPLTLVSVSVTPRMVRVLPRGNWLDDSGEVMEPAGPAALPALQIGDRQQARLDLARWLVARDNPLTARVFVNRLWKLCFGQGIVKTLDDFGTQGQWPTHPELLDWLASDFMDHGWNVKRMLKQLVMTQTYQQSSLVTPSMRELDPNNQWLARQSRFRLDAEMVRDNALAVSGLMSRQIGGPSVKPYQPAGYWQHLNFPMREWQNDQGESLYRRGLYTHWQRTFLHPMLANFDAPNRDECTANRNVSNTPQQALTLLNDPTFVEAARVLAGSILSSPAKSDAARLDALFQRAVARPAKAKERESLAKFLAEQRAHYSANAEDTQKLLKVGLAPQPQAKETAELAAWTSLCRVVLNLHETVTRY
jgi:hypothetical protein